jgi:hypothetical protein
LFLLLLVLLTLLLWAQVGPQKYLIQVNQQEIVEPILYLVLFLQVVAAVAVHMLIMAQMMLFLVVLEAVEPHGIQAYYSEQTALLIKATLVEQEKKELPRGLAAVAAVLEL